MRLAEGICCVLAAVQDLAVHAAVAAAAAAAAAAADFSVLKSGLGRVVLSHTVCPAACRSPCALLGYCKPQRQAISAFCWVAPHRAIVAGPVSAQR
eukprot:2691800-Amphidinium_carterae.1